MVLAQVGATGHSQGGGPITAWLRFHLMGDEQARGEFFGDGCTYCTSPDWTRFERNAKAMEVPARAILVDRAVECPHVAQRADASDQLGLHHAD